MKKQVLILWVSFIICLSITVGLWFVVNKSNPTYDEVKVTVLSSKTKQVKNKKNNSTYTTYEIEVDYEGKTYNLENAHNSYSYMEGRSITAYMKNNKIFANVEGVKNETPAGKAYFVFLIGSIVLFFVSLVETSKIKANKKEED